jgi:hypothetical protein
VCDGIFDFQAGVGAAVTTDQECVAEEKGESSGAFGSQQLNSYWLDSMLSVV